LGPSDRRCKSCRADQFQTLPWPSDLRHPPSRRTDAGGSPAGSANLGACGLTRIAEGPDSESGSLGGASPFMPTISRRLASAGTADPGDLKSPSLPGASPGSPTSFVSGPLRFGRPACGSQGIADRFGSNPNSLGSASLPTPTTLECQPDKRTGPVC
jgi:hypothetical protein